MKSNARKLVTAALIGALYASLTMAFGFCSYGPIQFRISEMLCVLPFFFPFSAVGLYVGCLVANLISAAGLPDVLFGSLATLFAGLSAAAIGIVVRRRSGSHKQDNRAGAASWGTCAVVCAMPVIFNVPIVGAILAYVYPLNSFWQGFLIYGAQVGLGELVVMLVLGLPLMRYFMKSKYFNELFSSLR